jgi:hypothetical protein
MIIDASAGVLVLFWYSGKFVTEVWFYGVGWLGGGCGGREEKRECPSTPYSTMDCSIYI